MRVLLIGAGRYGNLAGRKYASGAFGVKLAGVIDPKIDKIKKAANYCMNGIPTYHSLEEVPLKEIKECVADVALIPQIVPEIYGKLVNIGVRKIILPKPVAMSQKEYREMLEITKENNVQALVASNWHYSSITKSLKSLIDRIAGSEYEKSNDTAITRSLTTKEIPVIKSVDIEYSKEDEVLTIDPPMQELPHALQILFSTDLYRGKGNANMVIDKQKQSKSRVNVELRNVDGIREGIRINSDLKSGEKLGKKRERTVKIVIDKNGNQSTINVDYDAFFDENGICRKPQKIEYEYVEGGRNEGYSYTIDEDNMDIMYKTMLDEFRGRDCKSLTIESYRPISETLTDVEAKWKSTVTESL